MEDTDMKEAVHSRLHELHSSFFEVQTRLEHLLAENQRMREVIRLAESELRKRRDQVHKLEKKLQEQEKKRLESCAVVDRVLSEVDSLISDYERGDRG
ncbi:MAG: hypothetical protein R8K21_06615 [Mariprofundales bacterium]